MTSRLYSQIKGGDIIDKTIVSLEEHTQNLKRHLANGKTLEKALEFETEGLMRWEMADFRIFSKSLRNLHEAYVKLGGDYGGERFTASARRGVKQLTKEICDRNDSALRKLAQEDE